MTLSVVHNITKKFIAGLSLLACTSLSAAPMTLVVDVAGIESFGPVDDERNTVLTFNVGANSVITSLDYTVNLTAYDPSYLLEIGVVIETSAKDQGPGVTLVPGLFDEFPGTASYSESLDLVAVGRSFAVGADGILRLEFIDRFDDLAVNPDGMWNFGSFTFGYDTVDIEEPGEVPEPATTLLMGAGLAMLGYAGRRRRAGKLAA
ncbi:PEP-CTERM sorting domain-containing protein [Telluria beijingensis]|uniref:PEP-CTERM sorting domain-containing protein n=1 Tax=Telluria beijingensis TaxID=3068633 RepID=UPI0027958587|nr:PEP-CTERM sorting domain-containing protein [Massilia sp. REN29]